MRSATFGIFATVLVTLQPVHAQTGTGFATGDTLKVRCENANDDTAVAWCLGYVTAIADVMAANNRVNGFKGCIPSAGVTMGQIEDVVSLYLNAHPESRHALAAGLAAHALEDAFPCKR